MNAAFHRSDAIDTLEELSFILLVHLALMNTYPSDSAVKHWRAEVSAFIKTLKRYNNGKKGKHNFVDQSFVSKILMEKISDQDERLRIETHISSKGYDVSNQSIDWSLLSDSCVDCAKQIFAT